jgi:Tfp pilus assembly protein PilO
MNRSRKDIAMMAVMGVLLLFAAYNFVFKPQQSTLSGARDHRARAEQSVSDAQLALLAPIDSSNAVPIADPAAAPAALAIPSDPAITNLLRQLQAMADSAGVALASVSPTPLADNPSGPGGSMQISITASGPHASVQAYLDALRTMPRLLVIEQIGITAAPLGADGAPQSDQLQVSARVFTLSPPAGTSVVDPAAATPAP